MGVGTTACDPTEKSGVPEEAEHLSALNMRSVGVRSDLPATLASDLGGSARPAEPKGRVDDLEIVNPQKAK